MTKSLRSLALAGAGAVLLSACGVLNALIPDQNVPEGVLGIGTAGVDVALAADPGPASIGAAQVVTVTEFSGTLAVDAITVDAIDELPDFVEAAAITETVALGDAVQIQYPTGGEVGTFTLTGLSIGGSVTISGTAIPLPALDSGALAVEFGGENCVDDTCTYTTADNVPEFDVALAAAAVEAYSDLLKLGGTVDVEIVVTATLQAPGLPADATLTVTLESLGAVIEF